MPAVGGFLEWCFVPVFLSIARSVPVAERAWARELRVIISCGVTNKEASPKSMFHDLVRRHFVILQMFNQNDF